MDVHREYSKNKFLTKTKITNTIKNFFYSRVLIPNELGCMLWIGSKRDRGYGMFEYLPQKNIRAHRFSYELHYGDFPKELFVCHKCDNPSCVAPEHLFLGTHQENMNDMSRKKRGNIGERHGLSKLTNDQVIEIKIKIKNGDKNVKLAKEYKVSRMTIYCIRTKRRYPTIGE